MALLVDLFLEISPKEEIARGEVRQSSRPVFTKLLADSLRPELRADVVYHVDLGIACDVAACPIMHEPQLRGVQVVAGVKVEQLRDEEVL